MQIQTATPQLSCEEFFRLNMNKVVYEDGKSDKVDFNTEHYELVFDKRFELTRENLYLVLKSDFGKAKADDELEVVVLIKEKMGNDSYLTEYHFKDGNPNKRVKKSDLEIADIQHVWEVIK